MPETIKKKRGPKVGSKHGPNKRHPGYHKKTGPKKKTDKQKQKLKDDRILKKAEKSIQNSLCCGDCQFYKECKEKYNQKKTDTIDGCGDFELSTRDEMGRFKKGMQSPIKNVHKGKRMATMIAERCGANGDKIVDFHFCVMLGMVKGASISERQESANWLGNRFAGKDIIEASVDIREQVTVEQKVQGFVSLIAERRKSLPDASLNEAYKVDKDTIDADYTVEKVKANVKGNVTSQVVDQITKGIT